MSHVDRSLESRPKHTDSMLCIVFGRDLLSSADGGDASGQDSHLLEDHLPVHALEAARIEPNKHWQPQMQRNEESTLKGSRGI